MKKIVFPYAVSAILLGILSQAFICNLSDAASKPEDEGDVDHVPSNSPPTRNDIEWFRVPFEKAEDELLSHLHRDLPKIEEHVASAVVYEVKISGEVPSGHYKSLRSKIERVILASKKIKLKQCPACDESRLYRTEEGDLKFEARSTDPDRAAKIAADVGASGLLYTELDFSHEDLQLKVQLIKPEHHQILWTKEYSIAEITRSKESKNDFESDDLSNRDSLSKVLIGEIAFNFSLSTGAMLIPTINEGAGTSMIMAPAADLFVGERFDHGKRIFGFTVGGAFDLSGGGSNSSNTQIKGKPVTSIIKVGPRFSWVFNPYNTTSARYSLSSEVGAAITESGATGYVGIGPEIKMINRYSISLMPIYFLPATMKNPTINIPAEVNGGTATTTGGDTIGKWGGLSILGKFSISW